MGPDCADSLVPTPLSLSFLHVLLSVTLSNEILFILSARGNPETSQLVRIIIKRARHWTTGYGPSFKVFRADEVRQLLGHLSEIVYSKQQEEWKAAKCEDLYVHLSLGKVKALFILGSQILRNATRTVDQNTMAAQL